MHTHPLTPGQRRWRRAVRSFQAGAATLVIGMALLVALVAVAMPWLVAHPETVRAVLSERLKRPVSFAGLRGEWTRSGPVFSLENVILGAPGAEAFSIDRAELALDFYAPLKRNVSLLEFRLVGLAIDAERGSDGRWRVARLGRGAAGDGGLDRLFDLGSVSLRDATLKLHDPERGLDLALARLDARLVGGFDTRLIAGTAWAVTDAQPLRFACELHGASSRCHIGARGLEPGRWLERLPQFDVGTASGTIDADVWLGFEHGLASIRIEVASSDLVLRGRTPVLFSDGDAIEPRARMQDWRLAGQWRREDDGWRAALDQWRGGASQPATRVRVRHVAPRAHTALEVDRLDLADWSALLALDGRLPEALRRWLYESAPRGRIEALTLELERQRLASIDARLIGLEFNPGSRTPGFESLSGRLYGDGAAVLFEPAAANALRLTWPHMFRFPIEGRLERGFAVLIPAADGARLEFSELDFRGEGFGFHGRVGLHFNGARPAADIVLALHPDGAVARAQLFWPLNVMPPRTVEWLDRALDSGRVLDGEVVLAGDLDDWPFRNSAGRFEATARVAQVDFEYHPEWPDMQLDLATLRFVNTGMEVGEASGSVFDARITSGRASIADFKLPVLGLKLTAEGSGETLLRVLRQSPIRNRIGEQLVGVTIGGRAAIEFDLTLPLKKDLGEPRLFGTGTLVEADLADSKYNLVFARASGRLRFSDRGFATDDLAVFMGGDPAAFSLAVGEFTADSGHIAEATLRGDLPIATVMGGLRGMQALWDRLPGRSEWALDLVVAQPTAEGVEGNKTLTLRSDLVGTIVDLPAPLRKDAASALPVDMRVTLPLAGGRMRMTLGELLDLEARLPAPQTELAAAIALGAGERPALPERGLAVSGEVAALDLGGWTGVALDAGAGSRRAGLEVDLQAAELALLSRGFNDTRVRIQQRSDDTMIGFEGAQILGWLSLPVGTSTRGIEADFERLHLPEKIPGMDTRALDPRGLPALHIRVKDLRLGAAQLGEARIETSPRNDGLEIERLETSSPSVALRARGGWTISAGVERTLLDAEFTADNLGRMLDAFGFAGMVDGGQTSAQLRGSWLGSPAQFSLARIEGSLDARIGRGTILEVDPGAGRVFGLMSIAAAPRRLALDFSDFFGRGLSFDSIAGRFELAGGDAYTENLLVSSPSADILIVGRTGLSRRDYDQELIVTPKVGSVLPIVGAIAGGPVGAAAGLVAQGVLKSPLDQITSARYRVSGGWDRPAVILLGRERNTANRESSG